MLKNYKEFKVDEIGSKHYYNEKEEYHRLDGPAIEYKSGTKYWYINNKTHRNIDPSDEYNNGTKYWCFKGKYHRIGGKAGRIHWYIHHKNYTKKEYYNIMWDI